MGNHRFFFAVGRTVFLIYFTIFRGKKNSFNTFFFFSRIFFTFV